jgi:hypothetical protein
MEGFEVVSAWYDLLCYVDMVGSPRLVGVDVDSTLKLLLCYVDGTFVWLRGLLQFTVLLWWILL